MHVNRIELFVKVAEQQSLAKTARGMHVSRSSVSQRLKVLENDFGVKLYKGNCHGIELTDAGQILLTTASQVLNQLDTVRKTLNPSTENAAKKLVVGASYNPASRCLPTAIAAFQKTHREIELTVLTSSRSTVEKWLRDGEIEVALIQSPSESCLADLFAEHFGCDTLALFAHPAHLVSKKQKVSVQELAHTPMIVRAGNGITNDLLNLLRSKGLEPNIVLRCATPVSLKAAVRKKMGIGILFHNLLHEEIRRKEVKMIRVTGLPRFLANSYIVYHKNTALTAPAAEFVALLRDMKSRRKPRGKMRQVTDTGDSWPKDTSSVL